MSLKSWWKKYEPHVGISSLIIGISSLIIGVIGLGPWFMTTGKIAALSGLFIYVLVRLCSFSFGSLDGFFRERTFMEVNKYVFLTWRQNRFAKREKLWAKRMRETCSKMMDCQRKIEKKQEERETVWMQLLDGNEISKAQKRQKIANNFLESTNETHEAAMERRIRVLVWLINYDQLDINKSPYRTVRDKYIPHQIHLREDSDIYFR